MGFARRVAVVSALIAVVAGLITVPGVRQRRASAAPARVGGRSGFAAGGWMLLWESDAGWARDLDTIAATGARWLRFDFDWQSAEPVAGQFNWSPIDRVVREARARGLEVLATPAYTPAWA